MRLFANCASSLRVRGCACIRHLCRLLCIRRRFLYLIVREEDHTACGGGEQGRVRHFFPFDGRARHLLFDSRGDGGCCGSQWLTSLTFLFTF